MNTEPPDDEDKKKGRRSERDREEVIPHPTDREFFTWLEKLFYDEPELEHFPQRIECHSRAGRHHERNIQRIWHHAFAGSNVSEEVRKKTPGLDRKPSREKLIEVANEITYLMQKHCNESRKSIVFAVEAWHFKSGDEPYATFPKRYEPKSRGGSGEDEDDEESIEKRGALQIIRQQSEMFQAFNEAMGGMIVSMERDQIRKSQRIEDLEKKMWDYFDKLERALSLEEERKSKREWRKIAQDGAEAGMKLAMDIAPVVLGQLLGKNNPQIADDAERTALQNFFKLKDQGGKLTHEQAAAAFGAYDDTGKMVHEGVLAFEQARILVQVSNGTISIDELDKVMPGGEFAISEQQLLKLTQVFPMDQLLPLQIVFKARMERRAAKAADAQAAKNGDPKKK